MGDFLKEWGPLIVSFAVLLWSIISFYILNNKNKKLAELQNKHEKEKMKIIKQETYIEIIRNALKDFISNYGNIYVKGPDNKLNIDYKKSNEFLNQLGNIQNIVIMYNFKDHLEKNLSNIFDHLSIFLKLKNFDSSQNEEFKRNVASEITKMIRILEELQNQLYE